MEHVNESIPVPSPVSYARAVLLAVKHRVESDLCAHNLPRGGRVPESVVAHPCYMTNRERGDLEIHHFLSDPPERLFCYVTKTGRMADAVRPEWKCSTFMGDSLGRVIVGQETRDNLGGTRRSVTLRAINGCLYHGTAYTSAGEYARIRMAKADRVRLGKEG